jgi:tRNA(fMet)-specific endonuclease VapC
MAGVVDTSAVIALERRGLRPGDDLDQYLGREVTIASNTASELLVGVHRTNSAARRQQREQFVEWVFNELPILSFDLHVARAHAQLAADLAALGQPLGEHDLIIAATALAHDREVITHDLRDFSRVPGLIVRQPSGPTP